MKRYVIGVDFGSDSARALIVDALSGEQVAEAVAGYPRWLQGLYQDAEKHMFRQHPLDYLEALTSCVREALERAGDRIRGGIAALSVDTTGSTPCPVDKNGVPLALLQEFCDEPDAMFHLWKDHTAIREAAEITEAFRNNPDGIDYTCHQGPYASEWFWAKILHTTRLNADIRRAAWSWVEHSDWIPALLVGNTQPESMYRCACAAGHKAYWHSDWGGLPSEDCLDVLDSCLVQVRRTYGRGPLPSTHRLGTITPEWAERLSLPKDTLVGGSSFDAHAGAVGAGVNERTLVLNLGTSAVDMFVAPAEKFAGKDISWIGGAAENSIIPGLTGLESGQSAFGDAYAWFRGILMWPLRELLANSKVLIDARRQQALTEEIEDGIYAALQRQAETIAPEDAPAALDWFNGRRYPHVNEEVRSALAGLNMGTSAPAIYRALVTATALGQKRILETLEAEGIRVEDIVAVGGIAQKSPFLMQTLSDALNKPVSVSRTRQACALGAAMYAAVAAGLHPTLEQAQRAMCEGVLRVYEPRADAIERYAVVYRRYLRLADFMDEARF